MNCGVDSCKFSRIWCALAGTGLGDGMHVDIVDSRPAKKSAGLLPGVDVSQTEVTGRREFPGVRVLPSPKQLDHSHLLRVPLPRRAAAERRRACQQWELSLAK